MALPQERLDTAEWLNSNRQTQRQPVASKFHHPHHNQVKPQLLSEQYRHSSHGGNPLPKKGKFHLPKLKQKPFDMLTFRPNLWFPNVFYILRKKADNSTGNSTTSNTTFPAEPQSKLFHKHDL